MSSRLTGRSAMAAAALALALSGVAPVAAAPSSGPGADDPGTSSTAYQAWLKPVPTNGVTGDGTAWITLTDTTAVVTVQVSGLLDAPHAQHLHIDGMSRCPTAEQATEHHGHRSVSVGQAMQESGGIGISLTTTGDTGEASALAVDRFPTGAGYRYSRTIPLPAGLISALRKGTAVLLVHGVDHNADGRYDDASGVSELSPDLPAEATDPALCGVFDAMQLSAVPAGAAAAGGGPGGGSAVRYSIAGGLGLIGIALLAVSIRLRLRLRRAG